MRPQVVSKTTRHYDALIRAIETEGLSVIPAISTLMDNREACKSFSWILLKVQTPKSKVQSFKQLTTDNCLLTSSNPASVKSSR